MCVDGMMCLIMKLWTTQMLSHADLVDVPFTVLGVSFTSREIANSGMAQYVAFALRYSVLLLRSRFYSPHSFFITLSLPIAARRKYRKLAQVHANTHTLDDADAAHDADELPVHERSSAISMRSIEPHPSSSPSLSSQQHDGDGSVSTDARDEYEWWR